mmetsp:Transcript_83052/g.240322  ORF Transcript_83052/g.240322 Transcript_83052/m.240322 type:complete len:274 (+) Transcript_83052:1228-2049(+)
MRPEQGLVVLRVRHRLPSEREPHMRGEYLPVPGGHPCYRREVHRGGRDDLRLVRQGIPCRRARPLLSERLRVRERAGSPRRALPHGQEPGLRLLLQHVPSSEGRVLRREGVLVPARHSEVGKRLQDAPQHRLRGVRSWLPHQQWPVHRYRLHVRERHSGQSQRVCAVRGSQVRRVPHRLHAEPHHEALRGECLRVRKRHRCSRGNLPRDRDHVLHRVQPGLPHRLGEHRGQQRRDCAPRRLRAEQVRVPERGSRERDVRDVVPHRWRPGLPGL